MKKRTIQSSLWKKLERIERTSRKVIGKTTLEPRTCSKRNSMKMRELISWSKCSRIEESGLGFKGDLDFKPHSIEYLFLGAKLTQFVDATSQNINPEWKKIGSS